MFDAVAVQTFIKILVVTGGMLTAAAYLVLVERWIAAWVQMRRGPNRVGIPLTNIHLFGLGQPIADGGKFIFKEDFVPAHVDWWLFTLAPIVEKHGVQVFECAPGSDGAIPDRLVRHKIDRQVTKVAHEHLIVFLNDARTEQLWQWVAREPGRPTAFREHRYVRGQAADALIQKLDRISIPISEEDAISITGVTQKLKDAFDKDKVTKKFYERFKTEHARFLKLISGIDDTGDREWYASLMLNRLMFIYFIEKKGFLDGDSNYLRNRPTRIQH